MRIGVVGPVYPDSLADNVISGLTSLGHEPVSLGSTLPTGQLRSFRAATAVAARSVAISLRLQRQILTAARARSVEATINVEVGLHPAVVAELRRLGPVAFWYPDALTNLGRQYPFIAPYTALFLKDPWLVQRVSAFLSVPTYYLPEACNPRWHRPLRSAEWGSEIVMAGNVYAFRSAILDRLINDGVPLRLYGPPPPAWCTSRALRSAHAGRYVARHEKAAVFGTAAAVLNTLHPGEIQSVNCRMFEAAACGALVITERREGLADLFTEGDHFLGFSDYEELREQVARVLEAGPGLRDHVGGKAAAHAHALHTYDIRLTELLGHLVPC